MQIILYSKPVVQGYLRPLARLFAAMGITANQVTVINILVSLFAYAVILTFSGETWPLLLIPSALAVRFVLNHVDGILAVEHGMQSAKGLILNELADIISDVVLYLPLALVHGISSELIVACVVLAILTEVTGILGAVIGADRRQDGPLGKRPRGVIFSIVAVMLAMGIAPGEWMNMIFMLMLPLLVNTSINRVKASLDQLNVKNVAL